MSINVPVNSPGNGEFTGRIKNGLAAISGLRSYFAA
jgi:hypothetical protein